MVWLLGVVLCVVGSPGDAELPPLIPRTVILAPGQRANPELSPDGTRVAYSAPHHGIEAIWVKTIGKDDDRVVASDPANGILWCVWQADGEHVLYFQDQAGDEATHLIQADVRTGATRDLTPLRGVTAKFLRTDPKVPGTALVHLNARDRRFFDLYRLDLVTGKLEVDTTNPGDVAEFQADHNLVVRAAHAMRDDNSAEIRVRDDASSPWRTVMAWGPDEMNSDATGLAGFSADSSAVRIVTSLGANAERMLEVNIRTGARTILAEDPSFDVARWMENPATGVLEAVAFEKERLQWTFLDGTVEADFALLGQGRPGSISIRSRDRADRAWLVKISAPDHPTTYYRFDRTSKRVERLFSEDPGLEHVQLTGKEAIAFTARDGMTIHGYLTLPAGVPPKSLPMVVLVHGGPWARDTWSLDTPVQWLASRGYAVLQVNFRASTGYGKAYQNAGNREWGGKVVQDLVDGKSWAVARGIADPGRVAIMGTSFGGYATLMALTSWPKDFACGVAINAFSDAGLFMASMPPKWTVQKARFETRMGTDPDLLRRSSPLFKADQVERPVFVAHNANDVRVALEHAELMVAALREHRKAVTFMVLPD
ncbi:MAG: S9 family peptidase, partial [Thermoanaerobaculaceae bacterium]|nr:S9 family peptidase [Thermoanaerobaculaceae bacterium]